MSGMMTINNKWKIIIMTSIVVLSVGLYATASYMYYWQSPARSKSGFHYKMVPTDPVPLHTRPNETRGIHGKHDRGYVLSLSYKDQITSSANRIASLQCWAKQWNMLVVSPFINGTFFRGPLCEDPSLMKYEDIFNISKWNAYSMQHSLAPFVPWGDFLHSAPRNVILIQLVHRRTVQSPCLKSFFGSNRCNFPILRNFWSRMLAPHRFRILKEVCIDLNLYVKQSLTREDFNALVWGNYSDYSPNSVSLVWNEWRGIRYKRDIKASELMVCGIDIDTTDCLTFTDKSRTMAHKLLSPTSRVFHDAEVYVTKYLNQSANYIAVMVRWEMAGTRLASHSTIAGHIKGWQVQNDVLGIFLVTDAGKYGSRTAVDLKFIPDLVTRTEELFKMLCGKPIHLEDYDKRFEDISNSTHPTYIAQLQSVIAAKARCLLMVGGGNFHLQTLNLYKELHAQKAHCFKTIY